MNSFSLKAAGEVDAIHDHILDYLIGCQIYFKSIFKSVLTELVSTHPKRIFAWEINKIVHYFNRLPTDILISFSIDERVYCTRFHIQWNPKFSAPRHIIVLKPIYSSIVFETMYFRYHRPRHLMDDEEFEYILRHHGSIYHDTFNELIDDINSESLTYHERMPESYIRYELPLIN